MVKLEKYNSEKTQIFNTGRLATPEIVQNEYPACTITTFVVGTDEAGEIFGSFDSLNKLRTVYGIDKTLTEDEAIAALEELMNTVPEVTETTVSAEERTAAALELIAMSTLPDVEEETEVTA